MGGGETIRKRKVSQKIEETVHNFYEKNSVVLPDKKYVGKKTHKAAGFLSLQIQTLHSNFRKENPNIQRGEGDQDSKRQNNF